MEIAAPSLKTFSDFDRRERISAHSPEQAIARAHPDFF